MADEKQQTKVEDPRYPVERLLEDSWDFLGFERHVAVGGLLGVTKDLTVAEAKSRIEKWLAAPVEVDNSAVAGA